MTDNTQRGVEIAAELARGQIALALLAEIGEHIAQFDSSKREADEAYSRKVNELSVTLMYRVTGSVRQAREALDDIDPDQTPAVWDDDI